MCKIKIVIGLSLFIILVSVNAFPQFYYSNNQQVELQIDSSKILLLFNDSWSYNAGDFTADYSRLDSIYSGYTIDNFKIVAINNYDNYDAFLDTMLQDFRVVVANPFYQIDSLTQKLVGRTICCKFGENVTSSFIDSLNAYYNVEIESENSYTPNLFLLSVMDDPEYSVLEISNIYYQLDEVDFCHPNFLGGFEYNGYNIYDHYWEEQWAMHRLFEIDLDSSNQNHKAYEVTTGNTDIIVAVIDCGFIAHEDLPQERISTGYDFVNMDNDPTPCNIQHYGWHGTGVVGIIGASHNRDSSNMSDRNTGIYGVAPDCKMMPIRIGTGVPFQISDSMALSHPDCVGDYFVTDERMAGAIEWAWVMGADIISCSWGGKRPVDLIEFAIKQASEVGRD